MNAQEQSAPLMDKVRVYVYRYRQIYGIAIRPSIYCDGKDVARIQSGRSVVLALTPGKHTLRSSDKQSQIDLELRVGQQYYIRIDLGSASGRVTLVPPEQGAAEFKQVKSADAKMIKDKTFLASDFVPEKAGER